MTTPPRPLGPPRTLVQRLLHRLQPSAETPAQRHERRMRRFAQRAWVWLAFMVVLAVLLVLNQLAGSRATMLPIVVVLIGCAVLYAVALREAGRRGGKKDGNLDR